MSAATVKKRRPKPVRFPLRSTLRYDDEFLMLVERMRRAVARQRRVDVESIDFSTAVRTLVVKQFEAASALADQPTAWPVSNIVELPAELWDAVTQCRNALANSRGSLYVILRKLNFEEHVVTDELRQAFADVAASKVAVERMDESLIAFVTTEADAAAAESAGRGS
jgi:hypothetical protein